MGVLTDILVAHESEAETIGRLTYPLGDGCWKGIDAKQFDMLVLAELLAVLSAEPFRDEMVDEFPTVYDGEEEGPWVYKVPDRLTGLLAALPETRVEEVARAWVEQESFPGKLSIEREHSRRKESFLGKLFGRGRGVTAQAEFPDFSPLVQAAREILPELRSLAREAEATDKHLLMWVCT